jgi:hypothetical protein
MTTTMLEKVSRAIEDAMASDDNAPDDLARAVLMALREPDEGMLGAGEHAWMNRNLRDPKSEPIPDCFTAMIDHALNEETK